MPDVAKQFFWSLFYYCFLLMFGAGLWVLNSISLILSVFLKPDQARKTLRKLIHGMARFWVSLMKVSGCLITNQGILKPLHEIKGGMLVIANHPSMFDAPLLLSSFPGLACVFKSSLKQGLLLPHTARTAGYMSNDEGINMLRQLSVSLRNGEKVLIFPEGTRTIGTGIDPFNKGYALSALRAGVPVQLISIRVNTPILSKRQHFLKSARWPVTFRLEMGPTIEAGDFQTVHQMNSFVENWFQEILSKPDKVSRRYLPAKVDSSTHDNVITTRFRVPADPFYCKGHMPDNPIVPGYAQMAWVHEILQSQFTSKISRMEYTRMKFLQTILPGDEVEILIHLSGQDGQITINRDSTKKAQGRVRIHLEEGAA